MQVSVVKSWSGFDALEPEWNVLLDRSGCDSVFLTFQWMDAFRHTVAEQLSPHIIVVRTDDGQLVGVAPFWRTRFTLLGTLQFSVLRYLGDTQTGQEYPDVIAATEYEAEVAAAIWTSLSKDRSIDLIWLPRVAGWTGAEQRLVNPARAAGFLVNTRVTAFSAVSLPASLAAFETSLSSNRRQQMRRNSRRVLQAGELDFRIVERRDDLPQALDSLFDLHQQRWQAAGGDGAFVRRPAMAKFYREFTQRALAQGWLRLYEYVQQGEVKAAQIGFVYDHVYHQMQEGYDPAFVDGVGNALRHRALEHAIDEGVTAYDFLGGESEHKRRWGAEPRFGIDLLCGRPTLKNRLLFVRQIWPSGRLITDHSEALVDAASVKQE